MQNTENLKQEVRNEKNKIYFKKSMQTFDIITKLGTEN